LKNGINVGAAALFETTRLLAVLANNTYRPSALTIGIPESPDPVLLTGAML
jgi:hypothetical protein